MVVSGLLNTQMNLLVEYYIYIYIAWPHQVQKKKRGQFAADSRTESTLKQIRIQNWNVMQQNELLNTWKQIKWQVKERGKERNRWAFIHITGTPKTIHLHTRKHYSHADQSKKWLRIEDKKNLKTVVIRSTTRAFFFFFYLSHTSHLWKQQRQSRGVKVEEIETEHNSPTTAAPISQHYHLKLTSKHAPRPAKRHEFSFSTHVGM